MSTTTTMTATATTTTTVERRRPEPVVTTTRNMGATVPSKAATAAAAATARVKAKAKALIAPQKRKNENLWGLNFASTGATSTTAAATSKSLASTDKTTATPAHTDIDGITKTVGSISDKYQCVHNNFSGILFAGPKAIVFQGKMFFLDWTVIVRWEDVISVKKRHTGVRFEVGGANPNIYDFDGLFNPERAWSHLVSLHNDTIIDSPHRIHEEPTPKSQSFRRTNSDPLRSSKTDLVFHDDETDDSTDPDPATDEGHDGDDLSHDDNNQKHNGDDVEATLHDNYDDDPRRLLQQQNRSVSVPLDSPSDVVVKKDNDETTTTTTTATSSGSSTSPTITAPPPSPAEIAKLKKAWSEISEDTRSYAHVAVQNLRLPCGMETFFDLFLKDGAKYSIPTYMEGNGDADIACSNWRRGNNDDDHNTDEEDNSSMKSGGVPHHRVLEYTHPVNAPMAPPMARAKKEQVYRHFDNHGLVLETKTFVQDVPMTDCFYVADSIRVEPAVPLSSPSDDEEKKHDVTVSMRFDIRFVKTTMFQSIISRTTKGEFEKFMNKLAQFLIASLKNEREVKRKEEETKTKEDVASDVEVVAAAKPQPESPAALDKENSNDETSAKSNGASSSATANSVADNVNVNNKNTTTATTGRRKHWFLPYLTVGLLSTVVIFQVWILYDNHLLRQDMFNMQQQMLMQQQQQTSFMSTAGSVISIEDCTEKLLVPLQQLLAAQTKDS